jgi:prepilin-type N-terminal cleavage/methylation domain-containing protein
MKRSKGFTLLEIMLALCVLSVVIFGFWKIVDHAVQLAALAEQESLLRIKVWNDMDQLRIRRIQIGKEALPADDDGIVIEREIEELKIKNGSHYLPGMYSVKITATLPNKKSPLAAEWYVYQP